MPPLGVVYANGRDAHSLNSCPDIMHGPLGQYVSRFKVMVCVVIGVTLDMPVATDVIEKYLILRGDVS